MASKTKADPTGQRDNRAKSIRRLDRRLEIARRKVIALFREIPRSRSTKVKIQNAETVVYDYNITPEQLENLDQQVTAILNDELGTTQDRVPAGWWYKPDVELPYRQGVLEELVNFNQLVGAAIVAGVTVRGMTPQRVAPEIVLSSPAYMEKLNFQYVDNYTVIKSLSERTSSQVMDRIEAGMQSGSTPTKITNDITERFDVSKSNAERIVRTQVNQAYTDAKMDASVITSEQTGLRTAVRHISALSDTSRQSHVARHGFVYTVADQRQWWNTGANRINCLCSVVTVLIDSKGKVI